MINHNVIKQVEKNGKGYSFDVLRAKVLYGTKATLKKPKYSDEMDFNRFDKKFGGKFDDIEPIVVIKNEPEFVSTGVDITTLSEILNKGDF